MSIGENVDNRWALTPGVPVGIFNAPEKASKQISQIRFLFSLP